VGGEAPPGNVAITELWNGTNWTEVNDLNAAKREGAGLGISTSGLFAGGTTDPGNVATNEEWNGTNWTEGNDINNARYQLNNTGIGTTSSGLIAGGKPTYGPPPANTAIVEEWTGAGAPVTRTFTDS